MRPRSQCIPLQLMEGWGPQFCFRLLPISLLSSVKIRCSEWCFSYLYNEAAGLCGQTRCSVWISDSENSSDKKLDNVRPEICHQLQQPSTWMYPAGGRESLVSTQLPLQQDLMGPIVTEVATDTCILITCTMTPAGPRVIPLAWALPFNID